MLNTKDTLLDYLKGLHNKKTISDEIYKSQIQIINKAQGNHDIHYYSNLLRQAQCN